MEKIKYFHKEDIENNILSGVQGHKILCLSKGDMSLNGLKNWCARLSPGSQKALGKGSVMLGSLIC